MFPFRQAFGFNTNKMELYPRRRPTEYYYEPQPMPEYQSRLCEHPDDKLYAQNNRPQQLRLDRIRPPRNSDMRMFRNSYFS